MTSVRRLAVCLIGMIIAIDGGSKLHAAPPAKEAMLVNAKTGKCLTIAGGTSTDNNVVAVQFDCDQDPSRRWLLSETNPDAIQIRNAKTNKCLTITGGVSTENNVKALQFDCDNDRSRTWRFNRQADGSFQIKNVQTGKCLTIAGGTLADNNLESVQFDCDDDPSRRWTVRSVAPASTHLTSDWSKWTRADGGVEYRFRWGWDPSASQRIDAIYQVHNLRNQVWHGAVRAVDCTSNTLGSNGVNIDLQPNETRDATFKTTNCGSAADPFFKPNVVQSSTF
jgi:cytolethal distending toxin subunit A